VVTAVAALKERFGITTILRVLNVATSTYYGWLAQERDPSPRRRDDAELLAEITEIHERSGGIYGSPRVHAILGRRGRRVSRKRVERLMRENGLQGAFLRKRWRLSSTRQDPHASPAPDLVNRDFTAPAPDRLWVADATRIPCGEGVFWLAAVRDVFSNRILGWRCSDRCDTDLILGALEYAIFSRDVRDQKLIHHSNRGSNGGLNRSSQHLS
jgi:putative transposase